jgi:ubiquinone/menaquinone biosynthesis C-methylase UbiE
MPFDDNMFDLIVCRAAFKNFSQPIIALNEIYRVLKDGGKAIIFDLRGNVSNKEITKYVDEELNVSGINSFLTKWIFKTLLIKRAYTKDEFSEMVSKSKFKACHIQESTISFEIELTK